MKRPRPPVVLVVEDEPVAVRVMSVALEREGYVVHAASEGSIALSMLPEIQPDVIVVDYLLPGMSGMDVLRYLHRRAPDVPVVMITGHGDERLAVEAMKIGAFTYLPKPLDYEELGLVLGRAVELRRLRRDLRDTRLSTAAGQLVGRSSAIERMRELIADVAPTEVTVLITGETGTGKEVVARAIHAASRRSQKKFVALNCAAIPETLLEAEMFGHTRGAFTGAERMRQGRALTAHGGTLFLDEIGDLPQSLQPKFLRLLEDGEVTPLGSDAGQAVDLRIVAATHRDLHAEVEAGEFRADLFYRLNVVPIHIPPLRERSEDIPDLVHFILPRLAQRHEKEITDIDSDLIAWLSAQRWPGNVRELENTLERLVILSQGGRLRCPRDSGQLLLAPFQVEKQHVVDEFERKYLEQAMQAWGGRLSEVARKSAISPRQLYNLLRKHGLVRGPRERERGSPTVAG
ncbi:MAG: sigma-54-dependent transcriptional regulator [Thermoanaerobaculia bacterium]